VSGIAATFDASRIVDHLRALGRLDATKYASARREIGEFMIGNVQDNFDAQRLFDGNAMPPSKAAQGRTTTWKRNNKAKGRVAGSVRAAGKTLIDTHRLYDSYVHQLEGSGVAIGSALIYAAIHHFGGETGAPGRRFTMAARPVLGVGPVQERFIGDFLIAEIGRTQ
jgi:phage virion morphogenesis protein